VGLIHRSSTRRSLALIRHDRGALEPSRASYYGVSFPVYLSERRVDDDDDDDDDEVDADDRRRRRRCRRRRAIDRDDASPRSERVADVRDDGARASIGFGFIFDRPSDF
tara:strand:- start:14416 stop:14742 length:327 start_codon:yes stop_codon:yes gene_type:complete